MIERKVFLLGDIDEGNMRRVTEKVIGVTPRRK